MKALSSEIIRFFEKQGFVIVSSLDRDGSIHGSAKGIVGIKPEGEVCLIDLYHSKTFQNLSRNPVVSITSVDEHKFSGYTLKGKAKIIKRTEIEDHIIEKWEQKVIKRISHRVITNVQSEKKAKHHPEAHFPAPKYLIVIEVENIIDLAPRHLKKTVQEEKE